VFNKAQYSVNRFASQAGLARNKKGSIQFLTGKRANGLNGLTFQGM
jgi:hypothetical protein